MNSNAFSYIKVDNKENRSNINLHSDDKENFKSKGITVKKLTRTPLRDITNIYENDNYSPGLKEKQNEYCSPENSQFKKADNAYLYTTTKKSSVRAELKFIR